jgi:hypothetical protein
MHVGLGFRSKGNPALPYMLLLMRITLVHVPLDLSVIDGPG